MPFWVAAANVNGLTVYSYSFQVKRAQEIPKDEIKYRLQNTFLCFLAFLF